MNINKRTKIVATIGPATEAKEAMAELIDAGVTTIRLNFSHGNYEEHGARIVNAKAISKEKGIPVSVMLDTKGPEVRVGKFVGKGIQVEKGQELKFYTNSDDFANKEFSDGEMGVSYNFGTDTKVGAPILVDDGKLNVTITDIKDDVVTGVAKNSHFVKGNKRINLPGAVYSMPFLTEKDIEDIKFGIDAGIDFIAASFVNTPDDILQIKKITEEKGRPEIKVISKIESQYAVDNFDEILKVTDGVMVARGDLGLEIPYYNVPVAQKMMVRKCRNAGKPVIVATQMLDSMESSPQPTRAEVTDVYFATELGADATMLSGESAAGEFPTETVKVMAKINVTAEQEFYKKLYYKTQLELIKNNSDSNIRTKIASRVADWTIDGDIKAAIIRSRTGVLLSEVAKFRPNTAIIGVIDDSKQYSQFGVTSSVFVDNDLSNFDKIKKDPKHAVEVAKKYGVASGDKIIVVDKEMITEYTI